MTTPKAARPRYQLLLEAQPGDVPAILRLRRLLKTLLRGYGFRCISAQELPPAEPTPATNEPECGESQ
jgi:hypothetical protein